MKIEDLQPQRGQFDFTVADAMVAFAEDNGQQVFGHTLSWCTDSTMPAWLRNGSWSRASLLSVLEQHITAVMTHFRGRVAAWDVVNEALNDDGTRRNCLWKRVIGDDWVDQAFHFARRADPGAKLFYNETKADVPNPKYEATVSLVRDLRARGVPVDGVGLQYHLTDRMPTRAQVEEAIARLGDLGVDVHISELDVPVWYLGSTPERKLARQAAVYRTSGGSLQRPAGLLPHHDLGVHGPLHVAPALGQEPAAAVRLRVPAEARVDRDAGGAPPRRRAAPSAPASPPAEPPTPSAPATVDAQQLSSAPAAVGASAAEAERHGFAASALRTWLARRALAAQVQVSGSKSAGVDLVARVREPRDRARDVAGGGWGGSPGSHLNHDRRR